MKENIKEVLEQIRPLLQKDGGDVEFVDVDESGVVKVKLKGACGCCPGEQGLVYPCNTIIHLLMMK